MNSGTLADIVVSFHFVYVLFTVLGEVLILTGGILKWKWIRNLPFRITHLAASFFVAVEALIGMVCPLTELEWILRREAGQNAHEGISFVGRIIRKIIFYDFPPVFFTILYVSFASVVIISFIVFPPVRKTRKGKRYSPQSSTNPSNSKSSD